MAFWGERFRRDDEEDIWEELKQLLANPPSEQEIMQKKKKKNKLGLIQSLNKLFQRRQKHKKNRI